MSKFILSSLAIAVITLATPSFAAGSKGTAAKDGVADISPAKPKPDQRVCIAFTITGSLLPHKTCKTYREWLAEGQDPLAK